MERRRRPEPPPTPPPHSPFSPFLYDISNYKTPLPHSQNTNTSPSPLFFTASKNTPCSRASLRQKPFTPSLPQSKAARRIKALELEQSRSARKAETHKAKTLKSFSRSVTAWLNFLFQNPKECGCEIGMGSDGGRGWKRQKNYEEEEVGVALSPERMSALRDSLKDVCSLEDLQARMEGYMSKKGCNEVLLVMSRLCKNIDEGRLKMKAHCPIVTDLALKEKSTKVLMCYNPSWLRIGLHIIFGGDSLLNEGGNSDQEDIFLKLIIENQFFTHMVIARSYSYNKLVEGLYRPGFYEALGSIILKKFLLLVITLDKAKCESTLPLKCGIDGMDGGSPLLFCCRSHIKSSRQAVQEFLSEAMHGEGDLLSHLAILGCKLDYQQLSLAEYEFKITNLFEDLQDGIMFCRAIQLLKSDASILSKVIFPLSSHKKKLQNCSTAMQYLKQAGVSLSDGDGIQIAPEDIVNADKELALSILWNMFVHLQVPLLIDRTLLAKEIATLKGFDVALQDYERKTELDLLLSWIKVACERQHIEISSFSSIIEGKALYCLIDYYLRDKVYRCSSKKNQVQCDEGLIMDFNNITTDDVHNFAVVQTVTAMLGNFPKVFQLCDMLDRDAPYDERSVIILLVFLGSRLICRKNADDLKYKLAQQNYGYTDLKSPTVPRTPFFRNTLLSNNKFQGKNLLGFVTPLKKFGMDEEKAASVVQYHFRRFTARKNFLKIKMAASLRGLLLVGQSATVIQSHFRGFNERKKFIKFQNAVCLQVRAASIIQSHFRGFAERNKFMKIKVAACFVQTAVRAWMAVTSKCKSSTVSLVWSVHQPSYGTCDGYLRFMIERHRFLRIRKSIILIQQAARAWFIKKGQRKDNTKYSDSIPAVISIQSFIRGQIVRSRYVDLLAIVEKKQGTSPELEDHKRLCMFAVKIQSAWKSFTVRSLHKQKRFAAIRIQSYWRGCYLRKNFLCQVGAVVEIQADIRCAMSQKTFSQYRFAAIVIQRFARGLLARKSLLGASYLHSGKSCFGLDSGTNTYQSHELKTIMDAILKIQRWWKQVLRIKSITVSATLIQSFIRGLSARRKTWKRRHSISTIQIWWRNILLIKSRMRAVILIQSNVRGWIVRRAAKREKHSIVVIQSHWKGYIVRKHSGEQVADLRFRLRKSSVHVDDNKRLINRLVSALSELLDYKSVSNIRHTCATLNMATELSEKCCETLVSAGAIDILLKQFHSLNRGIPDQEVLKHVVSTLRNISCHSQLLYALIDTPHAVEIIFQEFLRNKSEVFFITCELLKRICATRDGLETIRGLPVHLRRLNILVHELDRKSELQKRNARLCSAKDNPVRRLKAAADLMLLISDH